MELATIILAMVEAGEEHKSEAPFFILGGIFAGFAVLISIAGFMKPDFPNSNGAARGVMAVGVILVVSVAWAILYVSG